MGSISPEIALFGSAAAEVWLSVLVSASTEMLPGMVVDAASVAVAVEVSQESEMAAPFDSPTSSSGSAAVSMVFVLVAPTLRLAPLTIAPEAIFASEVVVVWLIAMLAPGRD